MNKLMKKGSVTNFAICIAFFVMVLVVLVMNTAPKIYVVRVNEIANEDIFAPWDMVNIGETESQKKAAAEAVQPVYKLDLTVKSKLNESVDTLFSAINEISAKEGLTLDERISFVKGASAIKLTNEDYQKIFEAAPEFRTQLATNITTNLEQILEQNITEEQISQKLEESKIFFDGLPKNGALNKIGYAIVSEILVPNMFYDEASTNEKIKLEEEKIEDVVIRKGSIVVSKGKEVQAKQIKILEDYGLLKKDKTINSKLFMSLAIMVSMIFVLFAYYTNNKYKLIKGNSKYITVIVLIQIISFLLALGLKGISMYLIPISVNVMMVALIIGTGTAMLTGILSSVLISYIVNFDFAFLTSALLSTVFCVAFLPKKYSRKSMIATGVGVGIINVLTIVSFALFNNMGAQPTAVNAAYGLLNGIIASIFTIGLMPFFETTFDLITPVRLLEYSNPNQPLLKRLLMEAPGTYYHSILVGNLAEAAAEEIGANALLCRVGANYHDIGKLKRPYFFKENQMTSDNPHDRLKPDLSAKIIISHVEYGVELGKKNRLPEAVVNIIAQHHGDTLVAYFYYAAKKSLEEGQTISEKDFRYPQNRPQSKEAALVMLADSTEAYIRSLTEPTQEQVEAGVRKIIEGKIQDGQMRECDLSFKEIETVIGSFVNVLAGIFHDRIEYPETVKEV